jgi:hypothetical protein
MTTANGAAGGSPLTVGILVFDDVEVLDFCGPYEVFSVARPPGADASPRGDARRLFRVLTLAAPRAPDAPGDPRAARPG